VSRSRQQYSRSKMSIYRKLNSVSYRIFPTLMKSLRSRLMKKEMRTWRAPGLYRDTFFTIPGQPRQPLFQSIEHTSPNRTYHFIFNKSKTEEVDTILSSIYNDLGNIGQWDECHYHYRYLSSTPVTVIDSPPPRSTPTMFWAKHHAAFQPEPIPGEISASNLRRPKSKCNAWEKVGVASVGHIAPTAVNTQSPSTGHNKSTVTHSELTENSVGSGTSCTHYEGAISGLSNLKRKMDKIGQERELLKVEHSKLEDVVRSVTNSLSKIGDDI
jgi:hypothetical protein